ncbi:MAG: glycosyltransferase [Candidatus Lokiarchaeota archaeon]|nr:glycosyltransferase [Candidatus Lokiarchaeota archaeon]
MLKIKISIIISIYNSHGAFERQVKYFNRMNLSDDIEFIFIDDGSNPPLKCNLKNSRIYTTNNKLAWTQGLGRNLGAEKANGKYLLMTDIDHIISKEAINDVYNFTGDKMIFKRFFAILTKEGELKQDLEILKKYGFDESRIEKRGLYASVHGNTFAIKKTTFDLLGGYSQESCTRGYHPAHRRGDDCKFNVKWNEYARKNNIQPVVGSDMYIFPIGRYHINNEQNPKGLFHNLSYKQEKFYKE